MKCRPRSEPDPAYPFTGDEGDADAMRLLLAIQSRILDEAGAKGRPQQPIGEFMAREDIEALTLLNHVTAYLDNRAKYAEMADELRGYLVIE